MARLGNKHSILRALFAKSGNKCAFPGCDTNLVNEDNLFICQVCHIEAANVGGERYNKNQNDEERRGYDNLILLCYPHHVETNTYSVDKMKEMKYNHESSNVNQYKIDKNVLNKISKDMDAFWAEVKILNGNNSSSLLGVFVDTDIDHIELSRKLSESIESIDRIFKCWYDSDESLVDDFYKFLKENGVSDKIFRKIPYYQNPFFNRNWEMRNIGCANTLQNLKLNLLHYEIKYLENYLIINPVDSISWENLRN